ncbi:MAG: phage holin family protein [Oscillospiraceae bacterium]
MDFNSITDFVRPELLILIPVLYLIGAMLKRMPSFQDKHIPLMLGLIGIALCILETVSVSDIDGYQAALKAVFTATTQGIMCAGCSVYVNQITKQYKQPDEPASENQKKQ